MDTVCCSSSGSTVSLTAISPTGGSGTLTFVDSGGQTYSHNYYFYPNSQFTFNENTVGRNTLIFTINGQSSNQVMIDVAPNAQSYQYTMPAAQIATSMTALYRWSSRFNGNHFYTTNPSGELAPYIGYAYEGIVGYIATSQLPGTAALYRWSSRFNGDHFYTTNPSGELAPYIGYAYEGIVGYIATSQLPGTTALYRWSSRFNGGHFYTTDPSGELAPYLGYAYEGIIGYIWTSA